MTFADSSPSAAVHVQTYEVLIPSLPRGSLSLQIVPAELRFYTAHTRTSGTSAIQVHSETYVATYYVSRRFKNAPQFTFGGWAPATTFSSPPVSTKGTREGL